MKRSGMIGLVGAVVGAVLLSAVGCGMDDPGTPGGDDSAQAGELFRSRRRPRPPAPNPGDSGGGSQSGLSTDQVISAAQTPDGAAIPQPSGANHTCPEVVVRLGFWSCPTIGDTCASGGRSCTCQRTDGEGQFPSWICN